MEGFDSTPSGHLILSCDQGIFSYDPTTGDRKQLIKRIEWTAYDLVVVDQDRCAYVECGWKLCASHHTSGLTVLELEDVSPTHGVGRDSNPH